MESSILPKTYFDKQAERVEALRARIQAREMVVTDGRVIPEDGTLPLGVGRRLSAAVLFLDICGFSSRPSATKLEQETLLRILSFFFAELIRVVEDYGGVVEKNTGDGLMAYFQPTSADQQDQSKRAVAAAMTIFYATEKLINPVIRQSGLNPIDFRICIDHGQITIAEMGAARRFRSFVAVGSTANIACKLLKFAEKNSILIGENVVWGLPTDWQVRLVKLKPVLTGFVYTEDQRPYPCYEFLGRWPEPAPI